MVTIRFGKMPKETSRGQAAFIQNSRNLSITKVSGDWKLRETCYNIKMALIEILHLSPKLQIIKGRHS